MNSPYAGQRPPGPAGAARIGTVASVLIAVATLLEVVGFVRAWIAYPSVKDDPGSYDPTAVGPVFASYLLASAAAAVVFIVWLRQVRRNAEYLCKAPHRRARGWVIGGWLCPVVNLWYPRQIIDDIIAASSPQTDPHAEELPRLRVESVQIWWYTWVGSNLVGFVDPYLNADEESAESLQWTMNLSIPSTLLTVVSAVYAVRVIQGIADLQTSRPWVAWWNTDKEPA